MTVLNKRQRLCLNLIMDALGFYGDEDNYYDDDDNRESEAFLDRGDKAREALDELERCFMD